MRSIAKRSFTSPTRDLPFLSVRVHFDVVGSRTMVCPVVEGGEVRCCWAAVLINAFRRGDTFFQLLPLPSLAHSFPSKPAGKVAAFSILHKVCADSSRHRVYYITYLGIRTQTIDDNQNEGSEARRIASFMCSSSVLDLATTGAR